MSTKMLLTLTHRTNKFHCFTLVKMMCHVRFVETHYCEVWWFRYCMQF